MKSLQGKTVFITGASAGIGKAAAFVFAEAGANVILNARRTERLESIAEELKSAYNADVYLCAADIVNREEFSSAVRNLPEEAKNIDILINNAGLAKGLDPIQNGTPENWDSMIDTNVKGLLYATHLLLPFLLKSNDPHIINIGSIAGREVYPKGNIYNATKFAVRALTKAMRIDLLEHKVRVSTVDPGMVETDFSKVRFFGDEEKAANVYKDIVPLTGEDIAEAALFCASRPRHVNIDEMVLTPLQQASAYVVSRDGKEL